MMAPKASLACRRARVNAAASAGAAGVESRGKSVSPVQRV